jgi:FKBP-type peptidyl-prolyl cis-trans isomerase
MNPLTKAAKVVRASFLALLAVLAILACSLIISTAQTQTSAPAAKPPTRQQATTGASKTASDETTVAPSEIKTPKEKTSYAIGADLAVKFKNSSIDVDPAVFLGGMEDVLSGAKPAMTDDEVRATLTELAQQMKAKQNAPANANAVPEQAPNSAEASEQSRSTQQTTGKLSDTFARAAFRALRAISGDVTVPELHDGQLLANRTTLSLIDEADAEARNASEQDVVLTLKHFHLMRLQHNQRRRILQSKHELEVMSQYSEYERETKAAELTSQDPTVKAMDFGETNCSNKIENALRRRRSVTHPSECTSSW